MEEHVHSGHRERVRREFLQNGFDDTTPPHKIVEMLLFYSIPRKDTNVIAHDLLNRFGTIAGILDASPEELKKIPGVSENTIALLKLIMPVARCYLSDKNNKIGKYTNIDDICRYLMNRYVGYNKEVFSVLSFSGNGKMLGCDIVSIGSISSVNVSTRDVIETVLKRQAVCAIMAHNHPSGTALPSPDDIVMTQTIHNALSHVNVKLIDHIIMSGDDYISMAQSRQFQDIFM